MSDNNVALIAANSAGAEQAREVRFFRDRYFPAGRPIAQTAIDLQTGRDKSGMALFRLPGMDAVTVGESDWTANRYEVPYIKEKKVWTADDLINEYGLAGANVLTLVGESPEQIEARRISDGTLDLTTRRVNREEWLSVMALSGGFSYSDGELSITIDFNVPAANNVTLAGAAKWDSGTQDVIGDIDSWVSAVEDGGGVPNEIVFGREAYRIWSNDVDVRELYKQNNIRVGALDETNRTDQFAKGTYKTLDVFKVSEKVDFTDTTGTVTTVDVVDPWGVWVIDKTGISTDFIYARIAALDPSTGKTIGAQVKVFARDEVRVSDNDTRTMRHYSRPFPLVGRPTRLVTAKTA